MISTLPSSGIVPMQNSSWNNSFVCNETTDVSVIMLFELFYENEYLDLVLYHLKACRVPSCSPICNNHGYCDISVCVCQPGYSGTNCDLVLKFSHPPPYCCYDTDTTLIFNYTDPINGTNPTPTDWIAMTPVSLPRETDIWLYTNSWNQNTQTNTVSEGEIPWIFSVAGDYVISLYTANTYDPISYFTFTYEYCNFTCEADTDCNHGQCVNNSCNCTFGYYGKDCSLGCDGLLVFTNDSGSFSSNNGISWTNPPFNCSWLIQPEQFTEISLTFTQLDLGVENPLLLYSYPLNGSEPIEILNGNLDSLMVFNTPIFLHWEATIDERIAGGRKGFVLNYTSIYNAPYLVYTITWHTPEGMGVGIIIVITVFVALLFSIFVFVYADVKPIASSSPIFLGFILLGILCASSALLIWIGEPSNMKCNLQVWLAALGFSLAFGTMFFKTWRLYRLWTVALDKDYSLNNKKLSIYIGFLVIVQCIILIIWTLTEPLHVISRPNDIDSRIEIVCSTSGVVMVNINWAFMAIILLSNGFIAFLSRKLPKNFREARWIGFTVYTAIFSFLVVPISQSFVSISAYFTLVSIAIELTIGAILGFIFGVKIIAISKPELIKKLSTQSSTTQQSSS